LEGTFAKCCTNTGAGINKFGAVGGVAAAARMISRQGINMTLPNLETYSFYPSLASTPHYLTF